MAQTTHSASRGEQPVSRQILENLTRELSLVEAVIITTLPRGGLQIVQPQKLNEALLKSYGQRFSTEDALTWDAIKNNEPARAGRESTYTDEFLMPLGYAYAAAAPLAGPVFEGYAGAIQVFRKEQQGDFTDAELRKLGDAARRLDNLIKSARASRAASHDGQSDLIQRPVEHQFIFADNGKVKLFASSYNELDDRLRHEIDLKVRRHLDDLGESVVTDRLLVPDSTNDNWIMNLVAYPTYPALGDGPVVFVCLQPTAPEWAVIRASDFQAEPEISRLVPALRFMQQEYHRGPTLVEISKTVNLSPFHFHRRFTSLFGITPKHFLLECQIHDAKGELLAGTKELARIASDCGFAHQSHFTSRFKQAVGLTPTRWRRMALARKSAGGE